MSDFRKSGRVFFKLLGISLVGAGGVVGYAWYDANFKKTIEDNVPYSNIALDYLFQYVPPASSVFGSEASRTYVKMSVSFYNIICNEVSKIDNNIETNRT